MVAKVEITGAASVGELQPGWSFTEDATPYAIGDSSGSVGSGSLSVAQGEDSEFVIDEFAAFNDDDLGSFLGTVSSAESNGATEETDTNLPLNITGFGSLLAQERTALVAAGPYNILPAGVVLNGNTPVGSGSVAGNIATGPGNDPNLYRLEVNGGVRSVATFTPAGEKYFTALTAGGSPVSAAAGLIVTPSSFVLGYTAPGSSGMGFFSRTTGALIANAASAGAQKHWNPVTGRLYVVGRLTNLVSVFTESGTFVTSWSTFADWDIAGSDTRLYLSEDGAGGVYEYTLDGAYTGKKFNTGLVQGLEVTADNTALITIFGNRVTLWDINTGLPLNQLALPVGTTTSYVVANQNFVYVWTVSPSGTSADMTMLAIGQTTLYTAFAYYAALGGLPSISYQAQVNPFVALPGWVDTPWNKMKELASARGVEIAFVDGVLTVRDIAITELDLSNVKGGSTSLSLQSMQQGARSVDISFTRPGAETTGTFYNLPGGEIITVQAGEVRYSSFALQSHMSFVQQPVFDVDYTVVDGTGARISESQWTQSGARLSFALDPQVPNEVKMTLIGPLETITFTDGTYRIGVIAPSPVYSLVSTQMLLNPSGAFGTGLSTSSNLSATYTPFPEWTHAAGTSGNAYAIIPAAPMAASTAYRIRFSVTMTSGTPSGVFTLYRSGSLGFGALGTMANNGSGVYTWEGNYTVGAAAASPTFFIDISGTGTGEKFALADMPIVEQLIGNNLPNNGFDGSYPAGTGGPYLYAWTGTAYASTSTKTRVTAPTAPFMIKGRGLKMNPDSVNILSGADPDSTPTEKATDVNNIFIESYGQAYDRGAWRTEQLAGPRLALNATVPTSAIEGFGLTAGTLVRFKESIYRIDTARIGRAWTSITATRFIAMASTIAIQSAHTMGTVDGFWDGTKYKDQIIKPLRNIVVPPPAIVPAWSGWGSSTIAGLVTAMTAQATSRSVAYYNGGNSGETAEHTLARMNVRPATLAAFTIPSSGSVAVAPQNISTNQVPFSIAVTISGIAGTLARAAGAPNVWSFTRTTAGSATAVAAGTPALAVQGIAHRGDVTVLNLGKNNFTGVGGTSSVDQMIQWTLNAYQYSTHPAQAYIVLGHFVDTYTAADSPTRESILAYNEAMKSIFGDKFIDVYALLTSPEVWIATGITPTTVDLEQQALGNKPPSLSADNLHLNTAGNNYLASVIAGRISEFGWV